MPYSWNGRAADTPERIGEIWKQLVITQPDYEPDKECVVVIILNTRFTPIGWNRVSVGTVNESHVHPREVLRPVIAAAGHGFVMIHNHPSGEPSPSRSDEQITRRMIEASNIMQIRMVDHLIFGKPAVGRSDYYSFREAGIIP